MLATACTLKKQDTPALTGPSELGTSITMTVSPDVLAQDGASQSLVTIMARDANGQPVRNLSMRVQIVFEGTPVDFGSLSARNVVTDANGRATVVYTAPPSAGSVGVDNNTTVQISVTPQGTDAANAVPRTVSIRLVPPGIVVPPDGLTPAFTVSPAAPAEGDNAFFDASTSTSNPSNPIVSYTWNFGDGRTASGITAQHTYGTAGNYVVTLTIADAFGRSAESQKQITVAAGARPAAAFTFSPNPSQLNQPVHFNATGSTAPAGRTITSYTWDFGEGTVKTTTDPRIDFVYTLPRTYVVSLIVTDNTGKTSLPVSQSITPQ